MLSHITVVQLSHGTWLILLLQWHCPSFLPPCRTVPLRLYLPSDILAVASPSWNPLSLGILLYGTVREETRWRKKWILPALYQTLVGRGDGRSPGGRKMWDRGQKEGKGESNCNLPQKWQIAKSGRVRLTVQPIILPVKIWEQLIESFAPGFISPYLYHHYRERHDIAEQLLASFQEHGMVSCSEEDEESWRGLWKIGFFQPEWRKNVIERVDTIINSR